MIVQISFDSKSRVRDFKKGLEEDKRIIFEGKSMAFRQTTQVLCTQMLLWLQLPVIFGFAPFCLETHSLQLPDQKTTPGHFVSSFGHSSWVFFGHYYTFLKPKISVVLVSKSSGWVRMTSMLLLKRLISNLANPGESHYTFLFRL